MNLGFFFFFVVIVLDLEFGTCVEFLWFLMCLLGS